MDTATIERLTSWTARRSGGRITITAHDDTGADVKVANVDTVEVRDGRVIATDKDGDQFDLAV